MLVQDSDPQTEDSYRQSTDHGHNQNQIEIETDGNFDTSSPTGNLTMCVVKTHHVITLAGAPVYTSVVQSGVFPQHIVVTLSEI